jgi:hypothetical protein
MAVVIRRGLSALSAQLRHAGADHRKIVSGTRTVTLPPLGFLLKNLAASIGEREVPSERSEERDGSASPAPPSTVQHP